MFGRAQVATEDSGLKHEHIVVTLLAMQAVLMVYLLKVSFGKLKLIVRHPRRNPGSWSLVQGPGRLSHHGGSLCYDRQVSGPRAEGLTRGQVKQAKAQVAREKKVRVRARNDCSLALSDHSVTTGAVEPPMTH